MFLMEYDNGQWGTPRIQPFGTLPMSPSISGLNYGQSIFEGMKAYRDQYGKVQLFRPLDHLARLNRSAKRLCMPEIPADIFLEGLKQLVALDEAWVPGQPGMALYIRPIFFATQDFIGMAPSSRYTLAIFTCPAPNFYSGALRAVVTEEYVRASEGGVGYVKMAGNYARAMLAAKEARDAGYGVVLWLDSQNRRFIEEYSTMNAFFVIDRMVVTPRLTGTILEGLTRDSLLTLCRDNGIPHQERDISIQELADAAAKGILNEAFGAGTAAVMTPVASITYRDKVIELPPLERWEYLSLLGAKLDAIRARREPDPYGWLVQAN
jgi:branched-chain amino acid aminotransferase